MEKETFSRWLASEMSVRGLNQSELARAVQVNQAAISRLVSGKAHPSPDTLNALAQAFEMPPITVFRAAGYLPEDPGITDEVEQLLHEIGKLDEDDQEEVLHFIRMKNNLRKKRQG